MDLVRVHEIEQWLMPFSRHSIPESLRDIEPARLESATTAVRVIDRSIEILALRQKVREY